MADGTPALTHHQASAILGSLAARAGRQLDRLDHWPLDAWSASPGLCFAGSDGAGWAGLLVVPVDTGGPAEWRTRPGGPAWIRWIGVADLAPVGPRLRVLLRAAIKAARAAEANGLWVLSDSAGWLDPYLRDDGFRGVDDVITLEFQLRAAAAPPLASPGPASIGGSPVELGAATGTDLGDIAEVDRRAFGDPWRYAPATLARELTNATVARVARLDGAIVGYATAVTRDGPRGSGHINRIAVDPRAQGKGIGRALLADTVAGAAARGAIRITLNTQHSNTVSRRLYRSAGFRVLGPPLRVYHQPLA